MILFKLIPQQAYYDSNFNCFLCPPKVGAKFYHSASAIYFLLWRCVENILNLFL